MRTKCLALGLVVCVLFISCSPREASAPKDPGPGAPAGDSAKPANPPAGQEQAAAVPNAGKPGAAPSLPPGLLSQWSHFQTALKTDDADLLAQVARFPLRSNEFGGDIASATILKQRYATLFPAKTKECLLASALEKLEYDGHVIYEVYCDVGPYPIRFLFEQQGAQYFWTSIDNINE